MIFNGRRIDLCLDSRDHAPVAAYACLEDDTNSVLDLSISVAEQDEKVVYPLYIELRKTFRVMS